MKRLSNYAFYGIICLMISAIVANYVSTLKRQNTEKKQIGLEIDTFPASLLSEDLSQAKGVRIVFIYSELECEECVISYLKALKEVTLKTKGRVAQVIGCGELMAIKFSHYDRAYDLNFSFMKCSEESLFRLIPGLEMPAIILINKNNRILGCWKADPLHMSSIMAKIRNAVAF